MTKADLEEYEILPAGEMQKKYGMYAENRPQITLDPQNVPEPLRHLIPLAEKFGIGCDITRHDLGYKTSDSEKQALGIALKGWHEDIAQWMYASDDLLDFSQEMYIFMQMCVFEMEECNGPGLRGKFEE